MAETDTYNHSDKITSKQLMIFISATQIGIGIITLPSDLAQSTGHDGWLAIVLMAIIVLLLNYLMIMLLKRYKDKSIFEISRLVYGKIIGYAFNILITIYLVFGVVVGTGLFVNFIRLTLLHDTPTYILSPLVTLPLLYISRKGFKPAVRLMHVSLISYAAIVIFILLIFGELRLSYILPVGEGGLAPIIKSMPSIYFAFIGFELAALHYPNISDKKNVLKYTSGAIIFTCLFLLFVIIALTCLFGENMLKVMVIPIFSMTRVYHAPVLERMDLYFTAVWYYAISCSLRAFYYSGIYSIKKVMNVTKSDLLEFSYLILVIVLSQLMHDINTVFQYTSFFNYVSMGVILFLVFTLILSFIVKRGDNAIE